MLQNIYLTTTQDANKYNGTNNNHITDYNTPQQNRYVPATRVRGTKLAKNFRYRLEISGG